MQQDPNPQHDSTISVTGLLEMGAKRMGLVACGWVLLVLVQGEMVLMIETKDRMFVTIIFFIVCFRYWHYICPQATRSLTEASRSLSANNIRQLALSIRFPSKLLYWCKLGSAMTSIVLSIMRLASHDFGQTEIANKATRDFVLIAFYVVALAEALMLLFALTFDIITATVLILMRILQSILLFQMIFSQPNAFEMSGGQPNTFEMSGGQPNEFGMIRGQLNEFDVSANFLSGAPSYAIELSGNKLSGSQWSTAFEMSGGQITFAELNGAIMNSSQLGISRRSGAQKQEKAPLQNQHPRSRFKGT